MTKEEALIRKIRKNELAQERFKDLEEYFGGSKSILEDRKEFKKWLERGEQNVKKVDELESKLEQQPSDDCVSRQAVDELCFRYLKANTDDNIAFYEHFRDLPPVTPTQRWIPISERLPKEDGEYLLFGKIDEDEENYIFIGEYDSCGEQFGIWQEQFDRTTLGCLGSEFFEYSSVLAWQPLPKPYEEKRGSDND